MKNLHKKNEIWLTDLNPQLGTEAGKTRPVLIVQTDLLNRIHPSTMVCPITSKVQTESKILRVHLPKGTAQVKVSSDIMIDQLRAIDNRRLLKKIGDIPNHIMSQVHENLRILLDIDL